MKAARRIRPVSEEYLTQGNEAFVAGRFYLAAQAFTKARDAEPRNPVILFNLASAKERIGEIEEAARLLSEALRNRPSWIEPAQRLALLLGRYKITNAKDLDAHGLLAAFAFDQVDEQPVASAALAYLEAHTSFGKAIEQAEAGKTDEAARALLLRRTDKALSHPLFLAALNSINYNPRWERLLTAMRRVLLIEAPAERFQDKALTSFVLALIRQCLANEYVFAVNAEETGRLAENPFDPGTLAGGADQARRLLLHLLYRSPLDLLGKKLSAAECRSIRPRGLGELLAQFFEEDDKQAALAADIRNIGVIKDTVSQKVAGQYEEHPYPRWTSLQVPREGSGRTALERFLAPEKLAFMDTPFKVLVAGAGTGKHAIAAAVRYGPMADVLAIDLSRRSLAYGKAKAEQLGVENIRFVQADLLELGSEEGPFDIIEAIGVLHHMAEPFKAWEALAGCLRPKGFMLTGLYSPIARRNIAQIRGEADYPGPGCDDDTARAYRQSLMNRKDEAAVSLTLSHDFYTLSEFRDLVLHEHERPIFLSEIEAFMAQNNRRFCGFSLPRPIIDAFFEAFPNDQWPGTFENWAAFEERHPHTFDAMYRIWCEPAA
jgi:ubiquinone/menaquinone biosynthesis C-methylase UbiE